jgi:uncharacterized membrane-anchored protein
VVFGIVLIFVLYSAWPLITGKEIILATRPVDPYDLFRGQYLAINYEINSLPEISGVVVGDKVYISLEEDDSGIWRYKSASLVAPSRDFISGTVKSIYNNNMNIQYGIEQFFFERGAEFSTANMTIKAKISSSGQARIVELLQNGEPLQMRYKQISFTP